MEPTGKWDVRYRQAGPESPAPARVLSENRHLLPVQGQALDLACGLGANALLLAEHGLETAAWDISSVAIARLKTMAEHRGAMLQAQVRDVVARPPPADSFHVIVVTRFLEKALAPALRAALRPGGLLFYQTFTRIRVDQQGPRNPAFLLADNELLQLFQSLKVRVYREEGRLGDCRLGFRNEAMLVAQKGA